MIGTEVSAVAVGTWPSEAQQAKRAGEFFHSFRMLRTSPAAEARTQQLILTKRGGGAVDTVNGGNKDRISKQNVNLSLRAASEAFQYDARGNLCLDSQWSYAWDGANRLVRMETRAEAMARGVKAVKVEFAYDGQNRRFMKRSFTRSGNAWAAQPSAVTLYYWQGWSLVAEASYAVSWSGTTMSAATFQNGQKFYWGLDASHTLQGAGGVGGLVGMVRKEGSAAAQAAIFPSYDGNGNVVGLMQSNGVSVAYYEYDSFGRCIRATGAAAVWNRFRFATKSSDAETGLIYHQARYYSSELGRFISADPAGESAGLNLYAYAENSPIGRFDYLGYATLMNYDGSFYTSSRSSFTAFSTNLSYSYSGGYQSLSGGRGSNQGGGFSSQSFSLSYNSYMGGGSKVMNNSLSSSNYYTSSSSAFNFRTNWGNPLLQFGESIFSERGSYNTQGDFVHHRSGLFLVDPLPPLNFNNYAGTGAKSFHIDYQNNISSFHYGKAMESPGIRDATFDVQFLAGVPSMLRGIGQLGAAGVSKLFSGFGKGGGNAAKAPMTSAPARVFEKTHGLSGNASTRNVQGIMDDMRVNGWQGKPIDVFEHNGSKYILDGHHRVEAAGRVGIEVPFNSVPESSLGKYFYNTADDVI
jgi:RHS repeat-associated protein